MLRLLPLLLALVCTDVCAQHGSGVYVGGHIRRERPNTITTLKNSSIQLDEGEYTMAQLAARGMADKDIASFTLKAGYRLTGYANPDLTGQSREWTDEEMPRMSTWYKRISSLKVERIGGDTGIESLSPDARSHAVYYDANGMRLQHPRRGLNLVRMDDGTVRKVMVR